MTDRLTERQKAALMARSVQQNWYSGSPERNFAASISSRTGMQRSGNSEPRRMPPYIKSRRKITLAQVRMGEVED